MCEKCVECVERVYYTTKTRTLRDTYTGENYKEEVRVEAPKEEAMLASSLCADGTHAPVLDIDFPAELIPSTTHGHFHLYLNKQLSWRKYKKLLKALYKAGIIEYGVYKMSKRNKETMVLLPGIDRDEVTPGGRKKGKKK